jgi:5'-methylthioinosine phosphorylase
MSGIIGIIGGSGLYSLGENFDTEATSLSTPFSELPVTLYKSQVSDIPVIFLPRHGKDHATPPHKINYRANLWALKEKKVSAIIAVNVVGGITENMAPGTLVIPDQLIDYTWGREHTFFDAFNNEAVGENHVDFTWPYDEAMRKIIIESAKSRHQSIQTGGVYGCTQGPRLESAAEVRRLKQDGCDIVGMTGMPEAALARELGLPYASVALVVNWAAGLTSERISFADITATLDSGISEVKEIIVEALPELHQLIEN